MPSHYYSTHDKGFELAHALRRDLRHNDRPTRFIINDGEMVIDDRLLEAAHDRKNKHKSTNTIIYNGAGSTLHIHHHKSRSHEVSTPSPSFTECKSCFRRDVGGLYKGYCHTCLSTRDPDPIVPRRRELVRMPDGRVISFPERKALKW